MNIQEWHKKQLEDVKFLVVEDFSHLEYKVQAKLAYAERERIQNQKALKQKRKADSYKKMLNKNKRKPHKAKGSYVKAFR